MPAHLQQQLQELREQLAQQPPLSDDDRAALAALLEEIDQQFKRLAIDKIALRTDEEYLATLHGFFKRRGRRETA